MRHLILLIALTGIAVAQTSITLTGPQNVRPGKAVTLSVGLTTSAQPAGVQWTAGLPAGWAATPTVGATATAAGKAMHCSTDSTLCLVVGLNQTAIASGVLAAYAITVPAGAAKGVVSIPLSGLVAGDGEGDVLPITAGAAYSIRVLARHDLNGDGVTNQADLTLMIDQVTGKTACSDDQNGDGKCNVIDALIIIFGSIIDQPVAAVQHYEVYRNADGTATLPEGRLQAVYRGGQPMFARSDYTVDGRTLRFTDPCCEADENTVVLMRK